MIFLWVLHKLRQALVLMYVSVEIEEIIIWVRTEQRLSKCGYASKFKKFLNWTSLIDDNSSPFSLSIFIVSEYDVFGFKTVPEEEEEEEKLIAKVRALELKSLSMTDQEVSVGVKWENFLASTMNRDLVRSPELKALIRSGVPHEHRSKVWRWCVSFHVKKFRDQLPADYYETLLNVARDKPNPATKQIELDLLRTLPNNKHYASPSADGIQKLRNVLMAFSWRNPDIGYCQGLNRYWKCFRWLTPTKNLIMHWRHSFHCMLFPQAGSNCLALSGSRGCLLEPHCHCGGLHAKRLLHQDTAWLSGKQAQSLYC